MFKKFLFSILILISFAAAAQVKTKLYVGGPLATNVYRGPLGSDSALYLLSNCGNPNTIVPKSNVGEFYKVYRGAMIYKDTCNNSVWTTNPDSSWTKLGNFFDTTGLWMDTTFALNDSTIRYCKGSTCWDIRNGSAMITYEGDTIIINNIKIKNALKIPLTDTTHAIKGCGNIIYDTINEHFYGDVCINGTHYAWQCFDCISGTGTVTSVATNDATGIKGGTITTTGTLFIDTAIISTKANVDSKTITLNQGSNVTITGNATQNLGQNPSWTIAATTSGGSTNSNIGSGYRWAVPNTNNIKTAFPGYALLIDSTTNANGLTFGVDSATLSLKYVRISDTAAMLNPYLRKIDTTNKWVSDVTKNATFDSICVWKGGVRTCFRDSISLSSGSFWPKLTTNLQGTISAQDTIAPNAVNLVHLNGSGTAAGLGSKHMWQFAPTLTGNATVSDTMYAVTLNPILIAGANGQDEVALNIQPTYNVNGKSSVTNTAIKHAGNIFPTLNNIYSLGIPSFIYSNVRATTGIFSTVQAGVSTPTLTFNDGSNNTAKIVGNGSSLFSPFFQIGPSSTLGATTNYTIDSKGGMSSYGDNVIRQLAVPAKPVITNQGTPGTTHYVYGWVCRMQNGTTTGLGPLDSTTTGAATLGANFNRITCTEVVGAAFYDLYLISTTGTANLGKVGTWTAQSFNAITVNHNNNAAGDLSTAPTTNTTGSLVIAGTSAIANLTVNGSISLGYVAKTANYTATAADHTIDFTANADTLTLPTAVGITGRIYTVVNSGAGACQIKTTSSQTFVNINAVPTTLDLAAVGAGAIVSYTVQSNGANWIVVAKVKNE